MLFPGHNAMQGSTDGSGTVTGTCRGKAYAVGCDATPRADTYEVGPTYTSTGRWSTYVGDFTCNYINYWCVPRDSLRRMSSFINCRGGYGARHHNVRW